VGFLDYLLGKDIAKIARNNDLTGESITRKPFEWNEEFSEEISQSQYHISTKTEDGFNN
jgi:hypothetical protein